MLCLHTFSVASPVFHRASSTAPPVPCSSVSASLSSLSASAQSSACPLPCPSPLLGSGIKYWVHIQLNVRLLRVHSKRRYLALSVQFYVVLQEFFLAGSQSGVVNSQSLQKETLNSISHEDVQVALHPFFFNF